MKTTLLLIPFIFFSEISSSQTLYGLAKTPGPNKQVYLAKINPVTGYVDIISSVPTSAHIGVGAGNTYDFVRGLYYYPLNQIIEVDVQTGLVVGNITPNLSGCNITAMQFACQDSSIYCINFCTSDFGKLDMNTGTFTNSLINLNAIPGESYTYDKMNNRYIMFCNNTTLYSIDLNNFSIDTSTILFPSGHNFLYLEYNCIDSCIYGVDASSNGNFLSKYNLNTHVFTTLSSTPFSGGGILGGGRSIDVVRGLYYYNNGSSIISVRLSDGALVQNSTYNFSMQGPSFVYYIQIDQKCYCEKPIAANIDEYNDGLRNLNSDLNNFNILWDPGRIATFKLYDLSSRLVMNTTFLNELSISTTGLPKGFFVYTIDDGTHRLKGKVAVVN